MDCPEQIEDRSKMGNCAQVLGTSQVLPMTQRVKDGLTQRLSQLESTDPTTDAIRGKQAKMRKNLSDEVLRQERLDILSAQVLAIMRDLSAPNVARLIEQTIRPFSSNYTAGLKTIRELQQTLLSVYQAHGNTLLKTNRNDDDFDVLKTNWNDDDFELQQTLYFDHADARKTQADEIVAKIIKSISMTLYIQASCLGTVFRIAVDLIENPTWGWLASEAIRLALIRRQLESNLKVADLLNTITLLHVSGKSGIFELSDKITKNKITALGSSVVYVVLEGTLSNISSNLLITIASYYSNKPSDIIKLSKLNKKFKLFFQSDAIWKNLEITYKWAGGGVDGLESQEWNSFFRNECGLPYFNCERIRSIANTTTRLRLFYGTLNDPPQQDTFNFWPFVGNRTNRYAQKRRDLVVMIGRTGEKSGREVHESMHFMCPDSATQYHLSTESKPIMNGGKITRKEPSPRSSRRNKIGPDPGTLIEQIPIKYDNYNLAVMSTSDKYVFRIRRIGDERLSFVHFNHNPDLDGNETDKEFYHLISNILDRAASFVIILNYNLENEDDFFLNLTSLYKEYISSRRKLLNNLKHCDESMSSRVGDPSPLLVLLSIDTFTPSANDDHGSVGVTDTSDMITPEEKLSDEEQEEQEQIIIMTAVARTHEFLKEIICKDSASNASMGWYVQPYERKSALQGPFKNGLYPGINWLIRAMQKQKNGLDIDR